MKIIKLIFIFIGLLGVIGCSSIQVTKSDDNLYAVKAWGSKNKTHEQLKAKVLNKAKEICAPNSFETVGSGSFEQKLPTMSQSVGGFPAYDPQNITHIFTQNIRCIVS